MKATEILMEEHRVIERVLGILEDAARQLEAGGAVRPGIFLDAADFVRGFADGCHHQKEEGVLFKSMAQHGVPVQGGPIGVMLAEHDQGRLYTRQMRAAAERLQEGELDARVDVIVNARGYANLLRSHILKEDRVLFPMAEQALPVQEQDRVWEGFERVEHEETGEGVHEKYLALAEKLSREVNSVS